MPRVEKWIEVVSPIQRVFDLFSDFKSMPQWMHGATEVRRVGGNRTRWILANKSSGTAVQWETETTAFEPGRRLAWRGVGGDVDASGDVTFEETKRGSTLLCIQLGYDPPSDLPSGYSGAIARLFGEDLALHLEEDLQRFKHFVEEHQAIQRSDAQQSRAAVALSTPVMPTPKQLAPTGFNENAEGFNLEEHQIDTHEGVAYVTTYQGPQSDDVTSLHEAVDAGVDQSVLQPVGIYRDKLPEAPPVQSRDVQPSRTVNIAESVASPVFQRGPKILQDDAPTIVSAASRPAAPSVYTRPLAQTADERREPVHTRPHRSAWTLYALLGVALALGIGLLWYAMQRGSNNSPASLTASTSPPTETSAPEPAPPVSDIAATPLSTASTTDSNTPVVVEDSGASTNIEPRTKATEREHLRAQLGSWIAATNARDIGRQMSFYDSVVQRYYLTGYVPRERVREDKSRLFAAAKSVDISAGDPEVTFDRRGNVATMRFRKQYDIENSRLSRRGEVLQELKWLKTDKEGWKIISERDLRVIR